MWRKNIKCAVGVRSRLFIKEFFMKKIFVLLAVFMIVSPIFAQRSAMEGLDDLGESSGDKQFAVLLNPLPLVFGIIAGGFGFEMGVEYAPVQMASVKGSIYYIGFDPTKWFNVDTSGNANFSILRVSLEGRWYPAEQYVKGFFLNGGFYYHQVNAALKWEGGNFGTGLSTWGFYLGLGSKRVTGNGRVSFSFEPTIDLTWPLSSEIPFDELDVFSSNLLGWALGVKLIRFGWRMGVAF
jgi:hypothetical protein